MFHRYRRKQGFIDARAYRPGEDLGGVSVSQADRINGSPKPGDMVARNPRNHRDLWLIAREYFYDNYEQEPQ